MHQYGGLICNRSIHAAGIWWRGSNGTSYGSSPGRFYVSRFTNWSIRLPSTQPCYYPFRRLKHSGQNYGIYKSRRRVFPFEKYLFGPVSLGINLPNLLSKSDIEMNIWIKDALRTIFLRIWKLLSYLHKLSNVSILHLSFHRYKSVAGPNWKFIFLRLTFHSLRYSV